MACSIERIETTDAAGGRVSKRAGEITEGRKGRRLASGIEELIEIIVGCAAPSGAGVERGELEIGRRRTRCARDIGYVAATGGPRDAALTLQQAFAPDCFGRVQVTADAGRLVVQRPQSLVGGMEHREELQTLDQRVLLGGGGIRVN